MDDENSPRTALNLTNSPRAGSPLASPHGAGSNSTSKSGSARSGSKLPPLTFSQRSGNTSAPRSARHEASKRSGSNRSEEPNSARTGSRGGSYRSETKDSKVAPFADILRQVDSPSPASGSVTATRRSDDSVQSKGTNPSHSKRQQTGVDKTGAGTKTTGGQLAQAKDRDFDRAFERCRGAIGVIDGSCERATGCVKTHRELGEMVRHVSAMLLHTRNLFHENSAKTIVSLNQLATALEAAATSSVQYIKRPLCTALCGGGAWDKEGQAALSDHTRALEAYATAMLLEHGFRASDLRLFASRPPSDSQRPANVASERQIDSVREEDEEDVAAFGKQPLAPIGSAVEESSFSSRLQRQSRSGAADTMGIIT